MTPSVRTRVRNRDGLQKHLQDGGIGCAVYYPVPFHKQECFKNLPSSQDSFPVSDEVAETIIALPIYPALTNEMNQYVVDKVAAFVCHNP